MRKLAIVLLITALGCGDSDDGGGTAGRGGSGRGGRGGSGGGGDTGGGGDGGFGGGSAGRGGGGGAGVGGGVAGMGGGAAGRGGTGGGAAGMGGGAAGMGGGAAGMGGGAAGMGGGAAGMGGTGGMGGGVRIMSMLPESTLATAGETITYTLTLDQAAPAGGQVVNLQVNPSGGMLTVTVPPTVMVPAGMTMATFQAMVSGGGAAEIKATIGQARRTAWIAIPTSVNRLVISEAFVNPAGTDDGMEAVEIYNGGNTAIDLSGYSIRAAGMAYAPIRMLSGMLAPGGCLSVTGLTGLENGGDVSDAVALFMGTTIVDAVIYTGMNTGNLADETGAMGTVDSPSGAPSGLAMHRVGPSAWYTAAPTPGNCSLIGGMGTGGMGGAGMGGAGAGGAGMGGAGAGGAGMGGAGMGGAGAGGAGMGGAGMGGSGTVTVMDVAPQSTVTMTGQTVTYTVTLGAAAPAGGATVNVTTVASGGSLTVTVPPTVTVPAGMTSATFDAMVSGTGAAEIRAASGTSVRTAWVAIRENVTRLVISEVLYDPSGTDTGMEAIELYNGTGSAVDLSSYVIRAGGTSYSTTVRALTGMTIMAGQCLSVTGLTGMQNGGDPADGVALYDGTMTIVDAVIYDGANSSNLPDETGMVGTVDSPGGAPSGLSLHRVGPTAWIAGATSLGNCTYAGGM